LFAWGRLFLDRIFSLRVLFGLVSSREEDCLDLFLRVKKIIS
jgi:hypothetical protein